MPYILEVQKIAWNYKTRHIGYMNKIFETQEDACAYYNKFNQHMLPMSIKNNYCSTIIEINSEPTIAINNIVNIIELIIHIKELNIEYIYNNNNILYCSKKYVNNLDENLHSRKDILKKIEENKKNTIYNSIYKALKVYKSLKS